MKTTKFYKRTLAIGLIILSFSLLLNSFIPLPDFALGLLTGAGLGIEIYGVLMLLKLRKSKIV